MYYIYKDIIDFFNFTMTKEEAIKSFICENYFALMNGMEDVYQFEDKIKEVEKLVKEIIYREEKEYPAIIRYFGIPNDGFEFQLCVVAKVQNNGSTYIFSEDKKFLERYSNSYNKVKKA